MCRVFIAQRVGPARKRMLRTLSALLCFALALSKRDDGAEIVTCGSMLTLVHSDTGYALHSHQINWGSGSGQQSVTAEKAEQGAQNMWLVREATSAEGTCRVGDPIRCGSALRLQHRETGKNLHSHGFRAPLTGQQEVTGFGESGRGDEGDDWIVECSDKRAKYWKRSTDVRLKHRGTGRYLQTSQSALFTEQNCRRCPIVGQQEVSASASMDTASFWYADQGVFFPPHDDAPEDAKDEL